MTSRATAHPLTNSRRSNGRAGLTGTPKVMDSRTAEKAQDEIASMPVQLALVVKPGFCMRCQSIRLSVEDTDGICMGCKSDISRTKKTKQNVNHK